MVRTFAPDGDKSILANGFGVPARFTHKERCTL